MLEPYDEVIAKRMWRCALSLTPEIKCCPSGWSIGLLMSPFWFPDSGHVIFDLRGCTSGIRRCIYATIENMPKKKPQRQTKFISSNTLMISNCFRFDIYINWNGWSHGLLKSRTNLDFRTPVSMHALFSGHYTTVFGKPSYDQQDKWKGLYSHNSDEFSNWWPNILTGTRLSTH